MNIKTKIQLKTIFIILTIIRPFRRILNKIEFYLIDLTDKII